MIFLLLLIRFKIVAQYVTASHCRQVLKVLKVSDLIGCYPFHLADQDRLPLKYI
jgi:hypothetical protein